jgi:hypothetical protein
MPHERYQIIITSLGCLLSLLCFFIVHEFVRAKEESVCASHLYYFLLILLFLLLDMSKYILSYYMILSCKQKILTTCLK